MNSIKTDLNPAMAAKALSKNAILEQIISHLHIRQECCSAPARSLQDAYHTLGQLREEDRCVEHMHDLFSCLLVSKAWSSVVIPQLWGHYAELQHILSIVYEMDSDELRYLDDLDVSVTTLSIK